MASIIAKRPGVGVAAGAVFGALGSLLISVEREQGIAGVLSGLYTVTGYFLLLAAFLSMAAGTAGLGSLYRQRRHAESQKTKEGGRRVVRSKSGKK